MAEKAGPSGLPLRQAGIDTRREDDRVILVGADGVDVWELNDTAFALWELCDGETRPDEIVTAICEAFAVPRDAAQRDVDRTVRQLADAGLLSLGQERADDDSENGASNP